MPTTISTLIWRDFLGTHVHPGRSRHRPAKMKIQSVCDYDYYRKGGFHIPRGLRRGRGVHEMTMNDHEGEGGFPK